MPVKTFYSICSQATGNIFSHKIQLACNEYTPKDDVSIPTGEITSVTDTNFDLRSSTALTQDLLASIDNQVKTACLL